MSDARDLPGLMQIIGGAETSSALRTARDCVSEYSFSDIASG